MSTMRVSLPVDLGGGTEVTDASLDKAYQHTEVEAGRGFFPIGHNAVWHGGVHLYAAKGSPVHAMFDGTVVAARLSGDAAAAIGDFGSLNFVVVEHEVRGSVLNQLGLGSNRPATEACKFYSLYMHLAPLAIAKGTAELAQVGWLAKTLGDAITASVGAGGGNKKADVELVQKLLIRAGIDPGPVDGLIGNKTINGIRTFQEAALYSNPDGRIDVGGATWKALHFASLGVPADDGFDEPLLEKLKQGKPINPGKSVAGGQKIWDVGPDGKEAGTWLVQWEVFSETNLFKSFTEVVDDAPFTADTRKILEKLSGKSWIEGTGLVSGGQIQQFYAEHPDKTRLREYAVKFHSEWAADGDAMVAAMEGRFLTDGLKEKVKPYAWYPEVQAAAKLPPPSHFHYHPVTFLRLLASLDPKRSLAVTPKPTTAAAPPPAVSAPVADQVLYFDITSGHYYVAPKSVWQELMNGHEAMLEATRHYHDACAAYVKASETGNAQQIAAKEAEVSRWRSSMTGLGYNKKPDDPKSAAIRELWFPDKNGTLQRIGVGGKTWSAAEGRATKTPKTHKEVMDAYEKAKKENFSGKVKIEAEYAWVEPYHAGFDAFHGSYMDGNIKAELQFLRYAHSVKSTVSYDPKKLKLEAKTTAGVSVDLARWESKATFPLPENGWILPLTDKSPVRVRIAFTGTLSAFVGATAELSLGVDVNLKPDVGKPRAGVGGGIEAFAGAKASVDVNLEFQWGKGAKPAKWGTLAKIGWKGSAAAGIGFSAKFRLDYNSTTQKFYFECGFELVVKLGVGSEWKWEVSAAEVLDLIYSWLGAADFSRIDMIMPNAFTAVSSLAIGGAILGLGTVAAVAAVWAGTLTLSAVSNWIKSQDRVDALAKNINDGKAATLMQCGTPEAKAEAVHLLCQAASVRVAAEEAAETASIKVLKSCKTRTETLKLLKALGKRAEPNSSTPVSAGFDLWSELVDFGEQTQLNDVLVKYGIIADQGALSGWKVYEA